MAFMQLTIVASEPFSVIDRDPSLTLKRDNFAYFMLSDIKTRFFIV
jgi:hypothetical protein